MACPHPSPELEAHYPAFEKGHPSRSDKNFPFYFNCFVTTHPEQSYKQARLIRPSRKEKHRRRSNPPPRVQLNA